MSHRPERKEKDCLNCGAIVQGRYCQVCGQENLEPKETFWGMVLHFFSDITHFDGKFFTTLKILLTKPGFLSTEYMKGRRQSYLNPVRMYVFTSAIFFLVFFSINDMNINFQDDDPFTRAERDSVVTRLQRHYRKDSLNLNYMQEVALLLDTSREVRPSDLLVFTNDYRLVSTIGRDYGNIREYDSLQASLRAGKDGWFKRMWNKRAIAVNEKYKHRGRESLKDITAIFLHKLPYLLFVSLPFFALILKLLYIRRRQFYYADHGIFSIHHYIFSFILLLIVFLFDKMNDIIGWGGWEFLLAIALLIWPIYLYIEMRRFYKQGWFKTFVKFFLLNILGLLGLLLLFVVFGLFSVFQL